MAAETESERWCEIKHVGGSKDSAEALLRKFVTTVKQKTHRGRWASSSDISALAVQKRLSRLLRDRMRKIASIWGVHCSPDSQAKYVGARK